MAKKKQEIEAVKPMDQEQATQWKAFVEKAKKEPSAPRLKRKDDSIVLDMPPEGEGMRYLQLHNLSGMTSPEAGEMLLGQIINTTAEGSFNATLAAVTEIKPQDAVEGLLAAQMVAAHNMAMKRAMVYMQSKDLTLKQADYNSRVAMQSMRLFAAQVEALAKWRNKGGQKITVQYLDNRGGQAVIGDVGQTQGGGRQGG